jgi:putative ABC transport system permease protein
MAVLLRGMRNAFRNKIRTFSIVIILGMSVGLALAMLVARQAVSDKIDSVKASVGNTVSVSPAGLRGFEGGGDPLSVEDITKLAALAHVKSIDQTLSDRLTTETSDLESAVDAGSLGQRFSNNNGTRDMVTMPTPPQGAAGSDSTQTTRSFTPPVTVVGTTNPTSLSSSQGGGTFALKDGKVFASDSSENVAVIGSSLAEKNDLKIGSTFTAYDQVITVVGIFDAGNSFANNQVLMPIKTVQTLTDQAGAVTSATVHVDSVENVSGVTTAATKALGDSADVTNNSETAETAIAPLKNIQTISLYSLIGAVAAGAVIILLTMIMIVRERRREIGVLKAIGASNIKIMAQFASEAVTLTLLGAVVGVVIGVAAGSPLTNMLVTNASSATSTQQGPGGPGRGLRMVGSNVSTVTANVGWEIVVYGLVVAITIAVIGSSLASLFIAKVRPAEVMRAD